ncbi:MAG: oxidoreductase, partial [Acidobacteria bacterium]|nr:oxidoreductase [Acidobacteriota bacterium]
GAVAPSPVRATQAEEFLKGKAINELNAEEAAKLAFADARPLSMNAYKVEIGRTLVKRSILAAPE